MVISMNKTIWSDIKTSSYSKLDNDINCEVLVIGGGITGILISHYLTEIGMDVVLVEMDKIGAKKTVKTTASITALQDFSYYDLLKSKGLENAKLYINSCTEAIEEYKKLTKEYDFDFEEVSSYKYYNDDNDNLNKEILALDKMKYPYELVDKVSLPIEFDKAIEFKNQAQMNPMKLLKELSKGLKIYENTKIVKVKENYAYTENNTIKANYIVISSGFPFLRFKGLYSLKMHQNKSYVITTENTLKFKGNIISSKSSDLYFRDYKGSLIIGGNDIKTGKKNNGFNDLIEFVDKHINKKIDYKWINQDCTSLDDIPYIGRLSAFSENVFVSTGFNLWGMTSAMTSAQIIRDLICKNTNKFEEIFNPSRLYKIIPLMGNVTTAVINLIKINKRRCTHLGCSLVEMEDDDSFECPCHGSKFHKNGKIIDGPAINNLKK